MSETVIGQEITLVLVVDDEENSRRLLRFALELEGYVVEEAADGAQALAAYERLQPDIILLDIMMPRMDGFAACTRIRALPGGDRTPVLMYTALEDPQSIDRAFEAGATDYVTKDSGLDALCNCVQRLLHTGQVERVRQAVEV